MAKRKRGPSREEHESDRLLREAQETTDPLKKIELATAALDKCSMSVKFHHKVTRIIFEALKSLKAEHFLQARKWSREMLSRLKTTP